MEKDAIKYLKIFSEHEEEFIWVLRQQEKLRLEYIMFLKKDLPEILNRQGIKRRFWNKRYYNDQVTMLVREYSKKIQDSIDLLSMELVNKIGINNSGK